MEVEGAHIDRLDRSLLRMEQIIEDIVTLIHKGEPVEEPSPVDLGREAKRAWAHAENEATFDIEGTQRQIVADPERVTELLESLFDNAVEHAGDESEDVVTVTVGFCPDGFYVADDGPGVPEADREQVFEPGYSTGHHSAGLGLSIVREIAMAHGWDLRVTDSDAGGARFEITGVEFRDEDP
jgi:signal transduction histidine kinase